MDRAAGISTALLHYFQKNPNRQITVDELMETFPQWDRRQIYSGVSNLRKTVAGSVIDVAATGVWALFDETEAMPLQTFNMTFQVLKSTQDAFILMSEAGGIYRAEFVG